MAKKMMYSFEEKKDPADGIVSTIMGIILLHERKCRDLCRGNGYIRDTVCFCRIYYWREELFWKEYQI